MILHYLFRNKVINDIKITLFAKISLTSYYIIVNILSGDVMKRHFEHQSTPCTVDNIVFLEVIRDEGYSMYFPAGVSKNKFIYLERGKMCYCFGSSKREIIIGKGEILFVPSGVSYSATYREDNTCAIQAQFDIVYGNLPLSLRDPVCAQISGADELMRSLVDKKESIENINYYRIYRVYELLWRVSSVAETKTEKSRLDPAITDIINNYVKQHKIDHYARMCAMSESGFRRHFIDRMGVSPVEYRNNIRLEEARKLIETGEYSVAEAAYKVGFNNVSFFCRRYKDFFGHTPKGK